MTKQTTKKRNKSTTKDEAMDIKDVIKVLEKESAKRHTQEAKNKANSRDSSPTYVSMTALKGGTGKTLLTFNVASLLAKEFGKKVLVIDVDPQHNMSNLLYRDKPLDQFGFNNNVYMDSIFEKSIEADRAVSHTHIKNVDVIPTTLELTVTEVKISGFAGRESILRNWVYDNQDFLSVYDYVFFDTNPTMSIVNINVFLCCDSIILISDVDLDAIYGINTFMKLFFPIQNRVDRRLEDNIKGLVINKLIDNTNMTKDFLEFLDGDGFEFDDLLLDSKIHHATSLAETKSTGEPISLSRNERSYQELMSLIQELLDREML